jgi:L-rhamnose isomerase
MEPARFPAEAGPEIRSRYREARRRYAALRVDAEAAIRRALAVPISIQCWQGDDVAGFEHLSDAPGGGLLATGSHPGRARNGEELRADLAFVLGLVPGARRVNIHACYSEMDGARVDRDRLTPRHFARWMRWAAQQRIALDFNPTYFGHPKAAAGMTLSHTDPAVRRFWIRHGLACRRIGEAMARTQRKPCVVNFWLPDGAKDSPADRWGPRARLKDSLDEIFFSPAGRRINRRLCLDSLEGKLFGLGSEDYVVGSFEFYLAYAVRHRLLLCLDMGHFHPTETIHDKLSALLPFLPKVLLHVSRPIRWDSDHVVLFNDDLRAVFQELVRGGALDRTCVAMDYFDASLNRPAAYVIGARATRKALLYALLEPAPLLRGLEARGRRAAKLGLLEELKTLPFGAVWDELCRRARVPAGPAWLNEAEAYEQAVLLKRN